MTSKLLFERTNSVNLSEVSLLKESQKHFPCPTAKVCAGGSPYLYLRMSVPISDVDSQPVQGDDGRDEDGGHNHVGDW